MTKWRKPFIYASAVLLIITLSFIQYGRRSLEYRSDRFLMDTLITIKVHGNNEKQLKDAVSAAFDEMRRIAELSDGFPKPGTAAWSSSDVCRINSGAGSAPVKVSSDIMTMLTLSQKYNSISGGAFDVTVGPLMDIWNFAGNNPGVPRPEQIATALKQVGSAGMLLNQQEHGVFLLNKAMKLDLGAVAKGYATEKALQVLRQRGITKALIDAGGNIRVLGSNAAGTPWRIGIKDPRSPESIVAIVQLEDSSAVTSGDYYRYFEVHGKRYHHILDPRSGYPPTHTMSATVITSDAGLADILSTIFFVLPPDQALSLAKTMPGVDLFLVTGDRRILHTDGLKGKIDIKAGDNYRYDQGR